MKHFTEKVSEAAGWYENSSRPAARFGSTTGSALDRRETQAGELVEQETLSRSRLRTSANGKLQDIQVRLELTNDGGGAPTSEIRSALGDRSGTSEDDGEAERGDSTFDKLTDALGWVWRARSSPTSTVSR